MASVLSSPGSTRGDRGVLRVGRRTAGRRPIGWLLWVVQTYRYSYLPLTAGVVVLGVVVEATPLEKAYAL